MKLYAVHICEFRSEPKETECYEACWSQGCACKTCEVKCYRAGWHKIAVDADNAKRVRLAHSQTLIDTGER